MPAVTITDLTNAKLDVDHIAAIATSTAPTATDRFGNTKPTLAALIEDANSELAQTAAKDAEQAAIVAVSARDAATLSAGIFTTTAAGITATTSTSNKFFTVISANDSEYLILYENVSGSAVEKKRYPSADKLKNFSDTVLPGTSLNFIDDFGTVALAVTEDGGVLLSKLNGRTLDDEYTRVDAVIEKTAQILAEENDCLPGYKLSFSDEFDRITGGIKDDGTLAFKSLETDFMNGVSAKPLTSGYPAEINMIPSYGQSLSIGADSGAPITTSQRFDTISFAGGVRTQHSPDPYTGFEALTERLYGIWGETPVSGAAESIKELVLAEDGLSYTQHSFQLLGNAPGLGGQSISNLSFGSVQYQRFVSDVQAAYTLAQAAGKSFKVSAFFWTQGEQDYTESTSKEAYKAALIKLRKDLEVAVKSITGQTEPLACISYQSNTHSTYHAGNPYIAVAQYEVAKENLHHYVAAPLYWTGANVHQTALNYKLLGAYYGIAYKRVVVDGVAFKPLAPKQIDRQGNVILIKFNVPLGKLVFDTTGFPLATNYGFSVKDASDSDVSISSVSITGPDTVKIVTATNATNGSIQYGAINGGNLRDTQGDTVVFNPTGLNHAMHNWCVIFNEKIGK